MGCAGGAGHDMWPCCDHRPTWRASPTWRTTSPCPARLRDPASASVSTARGSYRSGLAEFPHPAPQITASLRTVGAMAHTRNREWQALQKRREPLPRLWRPRRATTQPSPPDHLRGPQEAGHRHRDGAAASPASRTGCVARDRSGRHDVAGRARTIEMRRRAPDEEPRYGEFGAPASSGEV